MIMKYNLRNIAYLVLFLNFVSCNPEGEPAFLFEVPYQASFTIPAGLDPFQGHFFVSRINSRMAANLSERLLNPSDIQSVDPRSASISAIGTNARYDVVREISVRIYSENPQNNPLAPWLELFYRDDDNLRNATSVVDLIPTQVNAREEALEDEFFVVVVLFLRAPTVQSIDTRLDFSLVAR